MLRQEHRTSAVIKASELRTRPGEIIRRVAVGNEELVVERDGYPVIVLMPYRAYEQLTRERAEAANRDLVVAMSRDAQRQGMTEENFMNDPVWQRVKRQSFAEQYGDINIKSKRKPRKSRIKKA